jgi:hypothetical protein
MKKKEDGETKRDFWNFFYSIINHDLVNKKIKYNLSILKSNNLGSNVQSMWGTGQKQPEGDLVVLLTDVGNEPNWFGGISPSMKIICSDFQLGILFGSSIDIRFP